jgi:hypothetical protein
MKKLRHGGFMYDVRNAITHDGNPVIDAWADGLFFVAANIVRINDKNQIVIIEPPKIDVRQFCLEFSLDFAGLLGETLQQISHEDQFSMSVLSIDEVEAAVRASNVIPPFVKENFLLKRDEIAAIVSNTKISHIADAIKAASDLADYCKVRLG